MKRSDPPPAADKIEPPSAVKSSRRDSFTAGLVALPVMWTLLLLGSLWWSLEQLRVTVQDLALVAARASFQKDLLFRQWVSDHGGVYVLATDQTPPNPYLSNIPERDITTPSGRLLTLMNPAYVTRQLYELGRQIDQHSGHLTSLNPILPANAPDDWERQALEAFARGVPEVSTIVDINGEPHLRLIRPLTVAESCLHCHAVQGYKVGDIRGGLSVTVPMTEYEAIVTPYTRNTVLLHGGLWLTGLGLLAAASWSIHRRRREREQANAAVRASEARFRSYFELPLAGRAITSPDKGWLEINSTLCAMLGYGKDELAQMTWDQLTHPDDIAADRAQFDRVMAGEIDGYTLEKRFIRKDGQIVFAELAVQCLRRPDGAVDYFVALIQDITERKRIEAALRQSDEKHRILFTHSPDAYLIIEDGIFVDCNRAAEAMLGGGRAQIIGRSPAALSPEFQPDGQPSTEAATARIAEALRSGNTTFEWVHRRLDGTEFLVEVSISAMTLEGRSALFVTWRDMTARKRVEEALRESEARYRDLFESAPIGIYRTTPDGRILAANPTLVRLLGYDSFEELARHDLEMTPTDVEGRAPFKTQIERDGFVVGREVQWRRRDGELIYVRENARLVLTSGRQPLYYDGTIEDITERKQAEQALRRQNQYLAALQETTLELSVQLDLDRLFENIVARAAALVDADGGFFDMVDLATHALLPRVGMGVLAESLQHTAWPGEGVAGIVWQTGQPKVVNNYDEWSNRIGGFSHGKLSAIIGVPLLHNEQTLGVLGLAYKFGSSQTFGPETIDILTQFARLAAIAVDNARLFHSAQQELLERKQVEDVLARRARELTVLYQTSLEISAQTNLNALLRVIVQRQAELTGAQHSSIYLLEPDGQAVRKAVTLRETDRPDTVLPLGEGVAGRVAQAGEPLMVADYQAWAERPAVYADVVARRVLGVPLKVGARVVGVLTVVDHERTDPFTAEEIQLVRLFADQAAIALENARLYEQVQQHSLQLEERVRERTAELQAANERLLELDRLKDDFLSRISHELRTPLASIKIYLELLESGKPDRRDKYLQTLRKETDRLHVLIEEVLSFAQLSRPIDLAAFIPTDLNQLIEGRLTTWERLSAEHDLKFRLNLAPDLPRSRVDGDLFIQALTRLITNAVNYTTAGSVTVSTASRTADGQSWVVTSVTDTGPGIAPDELPHIFERFFRGRAAADYKTTGTGIGLAICREITGKLGGRLTVDTRLGEGATFTLWLPAEH